MDKEQLARDYEEAVATERAAWAKARGKHASTDPAEKVLWETWLQAANRVRDLAEQLGLSKR